MVENYRHACSGNNTGMRTRVESDYSHDNQSASEWSESRARKQEHVTWRWLLPQQNPKYASVNTLIHRFVILNTESISGDLYLQKFERYDLTNSDFTVTQLNLAKQLVPQAGVENSCSLTKDRVFHHSLHFIILKSTKEATLTRFKASSNQHTHVHITYILQAMCALHHMRRRPFLL